ncbi:hypothetical protein [Streptomyces sp. UNOB3_S3]|uniref:hypothetical protein n=1 Tax=Streptomyces sp. UNOB3_S3 TaxID=2871682 RepID=UPI001E34A0A7|nr:hypothetical protein [Streptomyces sp. UNOB3_S3]MCC3779862.1 hypothetical protein [Streptomyces sp. UNOB3_S3]
MSPYTGGRSSDPPQANRSASVGFYWATATLAVLFGALAPIALNAENYSSSHDNDQHSGKSVTDSVPPAWFWIALACFSAGVFIVTALYLWTRIKRERALHAFEQESWSRQRAIDEKRISELKTVTALATLLELNQEQIDDYHRIATEQANRSFRSSQRAAGVGLVVMAACFIAGLWVPTIEARVFIGALAAVGTALSGYLSRTYLHMYGQTLGQLNRYFDQPVLTGYYLTAERLATQLPDSSEEEMLKRVINQVLDASATLNGILKHSVALPSPRRGAPRKYRRKTGTRQPEGLATP